MLALHQHATAAEPLWEQRRQLVPGGAIGSIPDFWLTVLQSQDGMASTQPRPCLMLSQKQLMMLMLQVFEQDKDVLQRLTDISYEQHEEDFELLFHFDKNEYFDDGVLVCGCAHVMLLAWQFMS